MVLTPSEMLPLGTALPAFGLQQVWGAEGPLGSGDAGVPWSGTALEAHQAQPLLAQIMELSNGFRDPPTVQRWLRPMLVPMRPTGIQGPPSWLPEVPPLPGLPESNTAQGH